MTWHQLRHIHSSLLNDLKLPVKIAKEQLGQASLSTTLNIYTHSGFFTEEEAPASDPRSSQRAVSSAAGYRSEYSPRFSTSRTAGSHARCRRCSQRCYRSTVDPGRD